MARGLLKFSTMQVSRGILHILILSLVSAHGATGQASFNIFGQDERVSVSNLAAQPYRMVGRVRSKIAGQIEDCTGSLVGPDIVLTSMHCVDTIVASPNTPNSIVFYAAYDQGKSLAQSAVSSIFSDHKVGKDKKISYNRDTADWALLLLEDPIGNKVINKITGETLGWFAVAPRTRDFQRSARVDAAVNQTGVTQTSLFSPINVSMAGYSADKNDSKTPWKQDKCAIRGVHETGLLLHDCDNTPGSSGSPIFVLTSQGPVIVALNKGFFNNGQVVPQGSWLTFEEYSIDGANQAVDTQYFYGTLRNLRETFSARQTAH